MTEKRAKELKNRMKEKLGEFLSNKNFKEIFLCMGKNYRLVLDLTFRTFKALRIIF